MSLLQRLPKVTCIDYYFDIVSIPAWVLFERFFNFASNSQRN
uniref:Uncharacterized protein n=1 Tax=Meloidogyne enterolobii TaxID=390850 RepID=A0A6V7THX3_MELEN|nr:unnamed protein product [Meloidogyne enterolobii]